MVNKSGIWTQMNRSEVQNCPLNPTVCHYILILSVVEFHILNQNTVLSTEIGKQGSIWSYKYYLPISLFLIHWIKTGDLLTRQ